MIKKHCLFCDAIVPIEREGEYDRYLDCSCSPGGYYDLRKDSYDEINALPHSAKRDLLHIISAYIREKTDRGEAVYLSAGDLEPIAGSPRTPVTIEDKGSRLLQFLYRHSDAPGDPVMIHPLSSSYNLTYSPNLQELVYIIDKLGTEQLLVREGMNFQLTQQGWNEAAASAGGKKLKPCCVLLGGDEEHYSLWQDNLLPVISQYGYLPDILRHPAPTENGQYTLGQLAESRLIVADLTGRPAGVYFAAGYGLGLGIPVIWTVHSSSAAQLDVLLQDIRPLVWDTAEELIVLIRQKLTK
ncbi:hypothetical protein [Paenibacillus sp. FSL R7-0331]|uniref:hypothetical protein n=1 Tax=Paenibacillus sp. FSL R7-0331 TaxID=1536773 RepID=UPI0004F92ED4|nr:hypothetical protein [Paenibacillus sp. FSL R7-0331]AIQ52766.1 hypothetical protein R70331_15410 [Paenibacillus sp. FSL R7-0331]